MSRFYARMQQRRGTAAEWTASNPVLQAGELGYETDTEQFKIGNGTTAWNDLYYWEGSLPDQDGNSGKFLTTDGTDASWTEVDALPDQASFAGYFLTTDGSVASWAEVDALPDQTGNAGYYLKTDGTTASWDELSIDDLVTVNVGDLGDVTITGTPSEGEALLYDPVSQEWVNSAIEAGANVSTTTTAPSVDVENGDLWWNSEDGALYVYFEDYDSDGYWVEATAGTISFQSLADLSDTNIVTPADGEVLTYNGSQWTSEAIDIPAGTTISDTAPVSPEAGELWWDSANGNLYIYYNDGSSSQWVSASDGQAVISDTAPTGYNGQLWWNSNEGKLYVFYDDGTSSAWVAAGGPQVTVQATAPTGYQGQMWLDSTDGSMYVYYTDPGGGSSSWIGAVSRSGGILQVVSTHYTGTFSTSSSTPADVSDFSATITPRSNTSKILVLFQSWVGYSANDNYPYFLMKRNGTSIGAGTSATGVQINTFASTPALSRDAASTQVYKLLSASRSYVDSPASTSSLTYQVQFAEAFNGTSYVNRTANASNNVYTQFPGSDLTLIEIAG